MKLKTTIAASSAGASLCAILLLGAPLAAADQNDRPGAFDVAQQAPDQHKARGQSDDDDKKKGKRNGDRAQHREDRKPDKRDAQKNAKPAAAPQKDDSRKARRDEQPRRDASPKAAPAPAAQPRATQKPDDRRRDFRDTRTGDRKDVDNAKRELRHKAKPDQPPKGQAQPAPKVTPAPQPRTTQKPDDDRRRDTRGTWTGDRKDDDHGKRELRHKAQPDPKQQPKGQAQPPRAAAPAPQPNSRTTQKPDGDRRTRDAQRKDGKGSWRNTGFDFKDIQKQRKQRAEDGGKRTIIEEPDKRVIVRDGKRAFVRHDETERFRRGRGDFREERRNDGTRLTIVKRPGGVEIITVLDSDGRMLRRSRRSGGKEHILIDNRRRGHHRSGAGRWDMFVDLPPPVIRIPREKYLVEYDDASEDDIYEALSAGPIDRLERGYSLDEIRHSRHLRQRMRRVELNSINFEFGSWDVTDDQFPKLERVARAFNSILRRNPDVVFMIEGHTDAVGSDIDNLSLSDRRAETVASILTEEFDVPPENLVTQGYGEEFLKVETDGPERANRRVTVLNISPLLGSDRYSDLD